MAAAERLSCGRGAPGRHRVKLKWPPMRAAVLGFVNCHASTVEDLYRYINRHFYVLQEDVMDPVRLLVEDAEKEGRQGASTLRQMWELLKEARRLADAGTWDKTLADARAARP